MFRNFRSSNLGQSDCMNWCMSTKLRYDPQPATECEKYLFANTVSLPQSKKNVQNYGGYDLNFQTQENTRETEPFCLNSHEQSGTLALWNSCL